MSLNVTNLVGFGSFSGVSTPTFVVVGTGATNTASDTLTVGYPSSPAANDIIICAVIGESSAGVSDGDTTIVSVSNFDGFITVCDATGGKSGSAVAYKRATGSESGTETCTMSSLGATRAMTAIMYLFRGCITTGSPADGASATDNASGTTWNQDSLTTTVGNCLGVHIITAVANSATAGSFTGETGGDWTETNIYSAANGTIQLQTASLPSAGAITGGSVVASSTGKYQAHSFGLKPAT